MEVLAAEIFQKCCVTMKRRNEKLPIKITRPRHAQESLRFMLQLHLVLEHHSCEGP